MIKKKVPYTLLTATALATLLSSVAFAAKGDFYYGDASNLTRVQKSEIKDKKDELKANKDNLYYQIDDTNIVKYSDYILKIVTGWSTGSIGDAVVAANADATIRASADIVQKAAQVDQGETGIAVSSVSAITDTDVTVKLAVKPDTALTDADASKFIVLANGVANAVKSVTAVPSDATGVTYKLTLTNSLDKTQGNLTVNGQAPAAKVVTGSEYDYDFKVPTVAGVEVVSQNQIKVNFSEKMDASAADPTQYTLVKNSVSGTNLINVNAIGVLSADKKSALITIDSSMVPANYTLSVSGTVKDIQNSATYKVVTGTELYFAPTADQLVDATAPTLVSASYNSETKKLTVNFDEKVNYSTVDKTKITLGGVSLTAADGLDTATNSQTLVFSLSDATITKLPTGVLSLALADGAVADIAATPNAIKAQTLSSITLSTPPQLVVDSSNYDENTHILTLKFNAPVKMTTPANITLGGNALTIDDSYNNGESKVLTADLATKATDTVQIELGTTDAVKAGIGDNTGNSIAVTLPVNTGLVAADGTAISLAITKDIAITQDDVKPVLVNATYKNLDKGLYLEFSEPVQKAAIAKEKFLIGFGTDATAETTVDINNAIVSLVDANGAAITDNYSKYIKVDLSIGAGNLNRVYQGTDDADHLLSALFQSAYTTGNAIKVQLGADAVYDTANVQNSGTSNGNAAMTDAKAVTFVNSEIPQLNTAATTTKRQLTINFDARMNKDDVENVNNYSIINLMYPAKTVKVLVASQDAADARKVYLTVDTDLTDVAAGTDAYKITVTNVKSVDGVALSTTNNTGTFQGTTTDADTTAPVIKTGADDGVVLTSIAGKENDTIAVTFNEASGMDKASAENLANYSLVDLGTDGNGTTVIPLTTDSVSSIAMTGAAPDQLVTMTLKTINLQKDHSYKLTVTGVKDIFGNVISTTDNANVKTIPVTNVANDGVNFVQNDNTFENPTALGSVTGTKTTVTVAFAELVDAATASVASNYRVNGSIPSTVTYDATANKATFEIPVALTGTNFAFEIKGVKDLAGNVNANYTSYNTGVIGDLTAPTFAATNPIAAVAKNQLTDDSEGNADVITVKFDGSVDATTATDERNYIVKVNGVALKNDSNIAAYANMNATNQYLAQVTAEDTITLTLNNAAGSKVNFLKGDTIEVTAANVEDAVGNKMTSAAVSTTAIAADIVAADGTGTDGALTAGNIAITGPNTVTLTFVDDILPTSVDATDFTVDNNVVTKAVATGNSVVTLTLAAPIQNSASVKVSGSSTFTMQDPEGNVLSKDELFGTSNAVTSTATAPAASIVNPTYTVVQVGEGPVAQTNAGANANTKAFSSADTNVATVNATTGAITAVAAGTTTINYVGKDAAGFIVQTGSVTVTVYGAATVVNPTYTGTGTGGNLQSGDTDIALDTPITAGIGQTLTFTSDTPAKITVNATTGEVTWVEAGSSVISYKIIDDTTQQVVKKGSVTITAE